MNESHTDGVLEIERECFSSPWSRESLEAELGNEYARFFAAVCDGTVIGYIAASAVDNKYQLWLYSQRDRLTLIKPLECVATLNKTATTLTFDPPHWKVKVRVNIARFLPTLFNGVSIIPEKSAERLPVGFKKIYPEGNESGPFNRVRYL